MTGHQTLLNPNRRNRVRLLTLALLTAETISAQFVQSAPKLIGSGAALAGQGASVAISGDGRTVLVGGPEVPTTLARRGSSRRLMGPGPNRAAS